MVMQAAWVFPNNTPTELESYGFTFEDTVGFTVQSTESYTYAGSPTRYAIKFDKAGSAEQIGWPAQVHPTGAKGWVALAVKWDTSDLPNSSSDYLIRIYGASSNKACYLAYPAVGAGAAKGLRLYVENVLKATTASVDWDNWRYVALKFSMSTTTWSAQAFIDGVAVSSAYTETAAADTAVSVTTDMQRNYSGSAMYVNQVIAYNDDADSGEAPVYATLMEGNADGTNVGTWVPTAASDYQSVSTPLDATSNTAEASPNAADRLQILTNAGAATIATALGITPSAILGVQLNTWSSGQGLTAKATIGDGAAEASGANQVISTMNPTLAYVMQLLTPTGPAWVPGDQPEFNYDVVSI